jgi:hypothetical protein
MYVQFPLRAGGFFKTDDQLIADAHKIKHIPTVIVQGRYDLVCPMYTAHDLKKECCFIRLSTALLLVSIADAS